MPWVCARCDAVLSGTPSDCDGCGYDEVRLVRHSDLAAPSTDDELAEPTIPVVAPGVDEHDDVTVESSVVGRLKTRLFGR